MAGTLFAGNLRTGEILVRNIPATAGSASVVIGSAGTITATMKLPMTDPLTGVTIPIADLIVPGKCFLGYEENGEIINAGPIWHDQFFNDTASFTLAAAGLRSYFEHRFVIPLLAGGETPLGRTTILIGSLRTLAKQLVRQAQSWTAGTLPIVYESDIFGTNEREYVASELHVLSEALNQLSNVKNGPDIAFRPRFKTDPRFIEWVMVTGNPSLSQSQDVVALNHCTNPRLASLAGMTGYFGMPLTQAGTGDNATVTGTTDSDTLIQGMHYLTPELTTPGTYTASFDLLGPAGVTVSVSARTNFNEGQGSAVYTMTGGWMRVHTTYTLPEAIYTQTGFEFRTLDAAVGRTFSIRKPKIEDGAVETAWFTGATPDAGGVVYSWAGLPDASRSAATSIFVGVDHVWDLTVPVPAIRGVQITRNADSLVTDAYYLGGTPPPEMTPIMARATDSTLPDAGYPMLEDGANLSSVSTPSVLQEHANEAVFAGRFHEQTWNFEANSLVTPKLGDYHEGDFAVMVIKDNPRLADGRYRLRIMSFSVSLDSSFVSITCAPERIRV